LSAAYGAAAAWRRAWYARDPARQRWLARPVVSVGNLRVGGSGKTPVVEYIARLLLERGERPAILTRGYGRRIARDGVTVVSDGTRVLAELDEAGDEPLMLARALPGVIVLVGVDRYLSGRLAERRLGATVHLLALITAGYDTAAERIGRGFGISPVFRVTRAIGAPRKVAGARDSVVVPSGSRVFVVTGIARPDRFVADILSVGWEISGMIEFRDHHPFTARDIRRIAAEAKATGSMLVLTTEKDAVRLAACDLGDLPIASVPLDVGVEPAETFRRWLVDRIASPQSTIGDPQSTIRAPQSALAPQSAIRTPQSP
jgi:tetraacyldisaccharide 4'-kinase